MFIKKITCLNHYRDPGQRSYPCDPLGNFCSLGEGIVSFYKFFFIIHCRRDYGLDSEKNLFWPLLNEFLSQQSVRYQTHDVNIQFLHHHFSVKIVIDSNTVQVQYNFTMFGEYIRKATTGIVFYSPRNINLSADSPNLFSGPESRAAAFLVFLLGGDLRMFSVPATALVWMWKLFRPASNPSNLARGQSESSSNFKFQTNICEEFTITIS